MFYNENVYNNIETHKPLTKILQYVVGLNYNVYV